jgi:hypothetical protein
VKHNVSRQHPQNPDKTAKKERRLQEADAEIGRELGQMTGIIMDTLIRVSADLSGIGEAKCAPGSKPLVEEIAHEPFAQLNLGRLVQPDLRYIQDQEGAGNETEDHELTEESMQVSMLQRIVKGLIPSVEPDLTEGRRGDDQDESNTERREQAEAREGFRKPGTVSDKTR